MSNLPQNFGELDSPLEMSPLFQKGKYTFVKETKGSTSNNEIRTHLNIEI